MGFRAGRGAASAIRRTEVWKLRAASARLLLERRTLDGRDIVSWVGGRRGIAVFKRREKLAVMGDGRQRCYPSGARNILSGCASLDSSCA